MSHVYEIHDPSVVPFNNREEAEAVRLNRSPEAAAKWALTWASTPSGATGYVLVAPCSTTPHHDFVLHARGSSMVSRTPKERIERLEAWADENPLAETGEFAAGELGR